MEGNLETLGSSLLVPCVQELAKESLTTIPARYIRHDQDPPITSYATSIPDVPTIDMEKLLSGDHMELKKLDSASKEWGFFQIVTNGAYRSIEHRAVVNSMKERLSIGTFYSPRVDGEMGPAPSLITPQTPALFRRIRVAEYVKGYFARKLDGKSNLDSMRIEN